MVTRGILPPPPDFNALAQAVREAHDGGSPFLRLIGEFNFAWSNDESLLIYVIMLLLPTDEAAAAIVFATLNTTRARLDLVSRLGKLRVTDRLLRRELDDVLRIFSELTRLRNELNHATYVISPGGEITHARSMKLDEHKGGLAFGRLSEVDDKRLERVRQAVETCYAVNRRLWALMPALQACLEKPP
ncbi:hypothetical protein [Bosea sp. TND4EK4]|uniref:hypothetical protein n=1 Tax=Bosea sp. TND4EK4 TaxID=1907408 RepID=UPI0009551979|nr:hypothetical protein [Bosea sp. TND4EK4]SIP88687.1 hypothetical protein SAMN05880592_10126 [Bosea sp. TND4EK4]